MTQVLRVVFNAAKRFSLDCTAFGEDKNRTRQRNRLEIGFILT